jgi:hypothetical protein
MGDEQDPPIMLGRPFLNTTKAIIYIRTGEIHRRNKFGGRKFKVTPSEDQSLPASSTDQSRGTTSMPSKYSKLSPRGNSVFIFIFCTAYLD